MNTYNIHFHGEQTTVIIQLSLKYTPNLAHWDNTNSEHQRHTKFHTQKGSIVALHATTPGEEIRCVFDDN